MLYAGLVRGLDVRIFSIPKNFPTWVLLNQFRSSLSTSTSISLRLNSSGLLLLLEAFNKEDIVICISFWSKFLYPVNRYKKEVGPIMVSREW